MTTIESIYKKAANNLFPRTKLEAFDSISPYTGKPLSLDDMDNAIQFEAGL